MEYLWKSPQAISSDFKRDSGQADLIGATDIKTWANDEIRRMLTSESLDVKICIIKIGADGLGDGPEDFKSVIQAAYGFPKINKKCTKESVTKWSLKQGDCKFKIELDCPKCSKPLKDNCDCSDPIATFDTNVFDISGHPEWVEQHNKSFMSYGHIGKGECTSGYSDSYFLMRPTTNSFHAANFHIKGCVNLRTDSAVEYSLSMQDRMRMQLNIADCRVLLAYMGYRTEKGYLMVPDIPAVWDSIKYNLESKLMFRRWTKELDPKFERAYFNLVKLNEEKRREAKILLSRIPARKLKSIWENHVKRVPNYFNEEGLYRETDDAYEPWPPE